jgi:hypothetical protein
MSRHTIYIWIADARESLQSFFRLRKRRAVLLAGCLQLNGIPVQAGKQVREK